ncbi:MAG: diguanylate cyclase [Chloroflexi bacterium]|nr:diguanylate cyclase [Chloroflexota bacterium]
MSERDRLYTALFEIADAVFSTPDLPTLFKFIHQSLGTLIDARNFYIALSVPGQPDTFSFPYADCERDQFDPGFHRLPCSLTAYVVHTGEPQLVTRERYEALIAAGDVKSWGTPAAVWLGVPLRIGEHVIGVAAVQSYTNSQLYSIKDIEILSFVSNQIAIAIDRKRSAEALRESEERYRQMFETNRAIKLLMDPATGEIVEGNPAACDFYGYSHAELTSKRIWDINMSSPDAVAEEMRRVESGERQHFLFRHKLASGEIRPVEVYSSAITNRGRKLLYSIIHDISDRSQVEAELRKLSRAVEQSPAVVIITDTAGKIEYVNPKFTQVTGYTSAEAIGQNPRILKSGEKSAEDYHKLWETITSGEEWQGEFHNKKKNGELYWESASISPIRNGEGSITHFLAVKQDVTEIKRAEAALQEANHQLQSWVAVLEQRTREMTLLNEMGEMLQVCRTADEAYRVIALMLQRLFPQESGALFMTDESQILVEAVATWGTHYHPQPEARVFALEECWALRRGRLHLVPDIAAGLLCSHLQPPLPGGYLCVPMMAQGKALGVLHLQSPGLPGDNTQGPGDEAGESRGFSDSQQRLAQTVAEHIALSLANLKLQETLRSQSVRDPLTGLFNRRYMEESLEREILRAVRSGKTLGVIMLDLDRFKPFNDFYGHEAGDTVLREVGSFLKTQIRGDDIACRYGGEEFLLILPDTSLEVTAQRAEQLRKKIKQMNLQYRSSILGSLTVSSGIAVYPYHGSTVKTVLQAADAALYRAKAEGRDRVTVSEM